MTQTKLHALIAVEKGARRGAYGALSCGCVTHWGSIMKDGAERIAVNARLMDPDEIAAVLVHRFDGASTRTDPDQRECP